MKGEFIGTDVFDAGEQVEETQPMNCLTTYNPDSAMGAHMSVLFNGVDFTGLNAAIENMASSSRDLLPEEKTMAVSIIDDWQRGVVNRLNDHDKSLKEFLNYFTGNTTIAPSNGYNNYYKAYGVTEEAVEEIAGATGKMHEFGAFKQAVSAIEEFRKTAPTRPEEDDDVPYSEYAVALKQYEVELVKYNLQIKKLDRNIKKAEVDMKAAIIVHPDFAAMVKKIKKYSRNVTKYAADCRNLTTVAKMNVTIGSKEARESLRTLLDFVVSL